MSDRSRKWLTAAGVGLVVVLALMVVFPKAYPIGKVLQGIAIGSATGLLAVGLVLVYRTSRIVNFAYGAMGGLAAGVGVLMHNSWSVPWVICILVTTALGVGVGVLVEWVVVRRFINAPRLVLTVATIGLAQLLGGGAVGIPYLFGEGGLNSIGSFHTGLSSVKVNVFPVVIDGNRLLILAVVPAVLMGLSWFLLRTEYGMAVRAIAENSDRAMLLGIPTKKLSRLVWGLIGGVAALTVILKAPNDGVPLDVAAGPTILLPALAAAIVARLTSMPVAFGAGVGLGVIDQVVSWNFPRMQATADVVFVVAILVALLGQRARESRAEAADEASWTLTGGARKLPDAVARLPELVYGRFVLMGLVALVAVWFGVTAGDSDVDRVTTSILFAMAALSLVVLTGWSGTVSLGQFAIVGVGGVTAANFLTKLNLDFLLVLLLGALTGAAIAVVIGLPALRVKGLFLGVTTLAFAVAMNNFLLNPINLPQVMPTANIDAPVVFKHVDLGTEQGMYFFCLAFLALAILVTRAMGAAHPGRVLRASRDNPRGAAAMAVPVVRARIIGFAISGAIAGITGVLYTTNIGSVGVSSYPPSDSLLVFSMAVIGGIGSITGSLLGVALVQFISFRYPQIQFVITGVLVLVVLYAFPGGVGQFVDSVRDRLVRIVAGRRGIELKESFADGTVDATEDDKVASAPIAVAVAATTNGSGGESQYLLAADGVTASYGPLQVLFGVDFDIAEGELVALLGTNGAGKSTILKAVTGLLPPTGGSVMFNGESIKGLSADEIANKGLAMMPGGKGIFPTLTVAENMRLSTWMLRNDRSAAAASRESVLDMFPRLRERIDVMAGNLSGGEQQQLSLAMAFVTKPKLLCIDELSLGLAPTIVGQLIDKVREIHAAGTTIVVVEQSVTTALKLAERGVFLEKGQVRFSGPTRDLLERPDLLRSVFIGASHERAEPGEAEGDGQRLARGMELSVRDIHKSFGGVQVLQGIDITVPPGRIVGLIGHNGAGKTTLFDAISGFLEIDSGLVSLDGEDITDWPPYARAAAGIGRSFQEARLFPSLTVTETVMVALERHLPNRDPLAAAFGLPASLDSEAAAFERADELITLLGLTGYRNHRTGELSTGTRRIVEVACVLAQEPAVVLLDEPSAGVAQRETEALGPLLKRVQRETGCTMVIVEHDMALIASVCDELVALEQGTVIATGTPEDVLSHPRVIESYLGAEMSEHEAEIADREVTAMTGHHLVGTSSSHGNGNGGRRRGEPLRARPPVPPA